MADIFNYQTVEAMKINKWWLLLLLGGAGLMVGVGAVIVPLPLLLLILAAILGLVIIARPHWLVLVLAFSIPFQAEMEVAFGARLSPHSVGTIALALVLFLVLFSRRGSKVLSVPYLNLWLVYLFVGTLAIAIGPLIEGPAQGLWVLYRVIWSAPLIYLGIWVFLDTPQAIRRAVAWLAIGALLGSVIAITQTLSEGELLSGLGSNYRYLGLLQPLPPEIVADYSGPHLRTKLFLRGTSIFRAHGTLFSHNYFGAMLSVTVFLTWSLFRSAKGWARWFWLVTLVTQLGGVIATFSRSAWAAVAAGLFLIILWHFRTVLKGRAAWGGTMLTIMAVAIVTAVAAMRFPNLLNRFSSIFSPTEVPEFRWRLWVWDYALQQIFSHPVLGLGTSVIDNRAAGIPGSSGQFTSHNSWLDMAYQRGLIVLGIFVLFIVLYLYSGLKIVRNKYESPVAAELAWGLLIGGIAFFVSGTGASAMTIYNLAILFWFLMGTIMVLRYKRGSWLLNQSLNHPWSEK